MDVVQVELHRRLWAQICYLDFRAAEDQGFAPSIHESDFDTRRPLSLDEVDLIEGVEPSSGLSDAPKFTDMTIYLLRITTVQYYRRIIQVTHASRKKLRISSPVDAAEALVELQSLLSTAQTLASEFERNLDDLVRYCDKRSTGGASYEAGGPTPRPRSIQYRATNMSLAHKCSSAESPAALNMMQSPAITETTPEDERTDSLNEPTQDVTKAELGIRQEIMVFFFITCLIEIAKDMHTTVSVVNLSIAFGSLSVAITPLWWSYLAELYGRRLVYILFFLFLGIFGILAAISPNIGMFIAMRLLANASSASIQAVSAGNISDIFETQEHGKAMGAFMLGPMLGPMLAPIIGGALTMRWSWRSTQWFMAIYNWAVFAVMVLFIPEMATNLEENRDKHRNDAISPGKKALYFLLKPMEATKLLQYPPILITVYYTSIVFATYYLICVSIEDTFAFLPYSWSSILVGVAYIPGGLGLLFGAIVGGRW
ncbi:hypothetical protein DTO013E5_5262 [Penicillium roqueforti]|uniref:uncharacterized protein n=1 Tax=Penicillium roqueforti TaxID=5082 RepID=UPI0019090861|nr:uncharacterized protein LCP9604111_5489 [Penicillium roqueforti]KAF9248234.1 hypothetical protein LCP9604111_5489 [Penicillium roqueforti]KAI1836091.1 hypothetical protein CBS147337_3240 [Penicillium roqueforti]KAI2676941.1 hypothetical protein LCP963914a_8236 [Penicillium roqueforti]KAI2683114.1 hypothetical protein CBS147355_2254 [Penicillium roqueforti]KAI2701682.1 hypothetical protein CBS147372_4735 [Penicillium roqueforti]